MELLFENVGKLFEVAVRRNVSIYCNDSLQKGNQSGVDQEEAGVGHPYMAWKRIKIHFFYLLD